MRQVKLIRKKEFVTGALNPKNVAFVIHIAFNSLESNIHLSKRAQIAFLMTDKTLIFVPPKYTGFTVVFSRNLAAKLLKHTRIYDHIINLIEGQ